MRYNYKGFWGCDSCCDIEVHRRSDGKHVFIATEVPENRGTSITNYAEHLTTAMRRQHASASRNQASSRSHRDA